MSAADTGSMLDFAGGATTSDSGGTGSEVSTPEVTPTTETPSTGSEHTPVEGTEHAEGGETNPDGTPKAKTDGLEATKSPNLASIRTTLKGIRDGADPDTPEGKATLAAVKELHGSLERWAAAKTVFPGGVAEMQKTQEFLSGISGNPKGGLQAAQDAWETSQNTISAINESDQLLYEGDGQLIDHIVEDLRSENKMDALGKLAGPYLDALKANDTPGYEKAMAPHVLSVLHSTGVFSAINATYHALAAGNVQEAQRLVKSIGSWATELTDRTEQSKVDPLAKERAEIAAEKSEIAKGKAAEVNNGIASASQKADNVQLGADLKHFLVMPFFKGFSKENLQPLARTIQEDLWATLKADKTYQAQMKSLWYKPKENAAKIAEYHKGVVKGYSATVVRNAVQRLYPGYAKGGSAAGRVANAAAAKASGAAANAKAIAQGRPIYVAQKPSWDSLDMSHKDKNGKDDAELRYIGGNGFMKGTGKWVTWRK